MDTVLQQLNTDEVLRYMGMPPDRAEEELRGLVTDCARQLLAQCTPRWAHRTFAAEREEDGVRLEGGLLLPGEDLKRHLTGCGRVVVLCATLGAQTDRLIRRGQSGDLLRGLALDACATAAVEQLCDRAEQEIHSQFPGCRFPYRYSPGYGDLPMEVNGPLLDLLDAPRRMGLCCTDSHILTPRKSVTALIGVADGPIEPNRRSCLACPAWESCQYRKSGGHCGIQNTDQ